MKVIRILLALLLILLMLPLAACQKDEDVFAGFRGAYRADIAGKMHGVDFGAVLEADGMNAEGERTLTLTFYAPESLSGTVLTHTPAGAVSITAGGLVLNGAGAEGFLPLLHLLPTEGAIERIALDEAGHSVVTGEGFSLTLLEDGTPIAASNATVSATIVHFETVDTP